MTDIDQTTTNQQQQQQKQQQMTTTSDVTTTLATGNFDQQFNMNTKRPDTTRNETMLQQQGRTVNKGPLKRNTIISLIKETMTNLKVSKSFKRVDAHARITYKKLNRQEKNNKKAQGKISSETINGEENIHLIRIRGGEGINRKEKNNIKFTEEK
jgi:hypothetical protein